MGRLVLRRVVQKPEGNGAAELMGKVVYWLLLLAANLAEHGSIRQKHICVSVWSFLTSSQMLQQPDKQHLAPAPVLEGENSEVVVAHQKLAEHCGY